MTQSEFIKLYCERSKIEEKKLNELGECAIFCSCNLEKCEGWAMVSRDSLKDHVELYVQNN